MINPSFSFRPPEPDGTAHRPARQVTRRWFVRLVGVPLRRLVRDRNPAEAGRWAKALDVGSWPVALAKRHPGIPPAVWWTVNHTLLERTGISSLERIVDTGVDTLLVCGPATSCPCPSGRSAGSARSGPTAASDLELLDELDHASWVRWQRERLIEVVSSHLVTRYAAGPSSPVRSPDLRVGSGRPA